MSRFVMRTAEGPFPMETTYEWEDVEPGFNPDDAAQPGRAVRVLRYRGADDGRGDEAATPRT